MSQGFLAIVGLLVVAVVVIAVVKGLLASKGAPVTTFPYQKEPHLFGRRSGPSLGCSNKPWETSTVSWGRSGWPMSSRSRA